MHTTLHLLENKVDMVYFFPVILPHYCGEDIQQIMHYFSSFLQEVTMFSCRQRSLVKANTIAASNSGVKWEV